MQVEFEDVCGPKFMTFWDDIGDPFVVVDALDRLSISCFVPKIQAVKVAVKLRSRPKKVVLGPALQGKGIPQIGMRFQIAVSLLLSMWPIFIEFRSASSEIRRRKKKKRIPVKYKSADKYVGLPNIRVYTKSLSVHSMQYYVQRDGIPSDVRTTVVRAVGWQAEPTVCYSAIGERFPFVCRVVRICNYVMCCTITYDKARSLLAYFLQAYFPWL